jgi:hypothetical protein
VTAASSLSARALRRVCLTLAMLAVAVKVLVPAGFMTPAPTQHAAFPLVLCTGHGAVVVDAAGKDQHPAKPAHDGPCVFSGHGAALAASASPAVGAAVAIAYAALADAPVRDLAPGRGLVAPPLPPRGPPTAQA